MFPNDREIVLLGGGGHARSIIEVLDECGEGLLGYIDEVEVSKTNRIWLGPDLRMAISLHDSSRFCFFPAAGENRRRRDDLNLLANLRLELSPPLVSPRAFVAADVEVGLGSIVMPGAVVRAGTQIGIACVINSGAVIDHDCNVEDFAHVGPGVSIAGGAQIQMGAFLGVGSTVLPNVVFGARSILGAGGVAVHHVPPDSVYVGLPAKATRSIVPWD